MIQIISYSLSINNFEQDTIIGFMKKILVPTDFSDYSKKAMAVAVELASNSDAEILLLHCVVTRLDWALMSKEKREQFPETQASTEAAETMLARQAETKVFAKSKVRCIVVHGVPSEQIVWVAGKQKVDLIVMGSHGINETHEYFIGSNIQKTLRKAICPILMVKKNHKVKAWKKMVFASDFEENIRKEFNQIITLSELIGASINLLFVNTPNNFKSTSEAFKLMDDFSSHFKNVEMSRSVYNHHEIYKGVMEYCEETKADWVALVAHNRRRTPQYLIGNTETLVYYGEIPVMSINQIIR